MNKRWLKLAAVPIAFSYVLAACGSDDDRSSSDDSGGDTETTEGDTETTEAASTADDFEYQDVDFFYLPPVGDEFGSPLLTAGTFATAFSADEDTMAVLQYLASPEYVEARLAAGVGGFLSANSNVPVSAYETPLDQQLVEILQGADVARFDGSDLMPGAVGSDSFWTAIVDITTEAKTVAEAFADVEETWPDAAGSASDCEAPTIEPGDGSVTIFGPEVEQELEGFQAAMQPFIDETGIEVEINGDRSFSEQIGVQVEGGSAPDVAIFAQPGRVVDFARSCDLVPLAPNVVAEVDENFGGFADLGKVDGIMYGVPNKSDVKSLVWYSPTAFADGGYAIPETHDELVALMDDIKANDQTPWCIGIGSDAATGWPGTDWTEDYMLRLNGPEVYDQWVANELAFDDPAVVAVGDFWFELWSGEGNTFGGLQNVANTRFQDAGLPILDGDCLLHRQANFFAAQWPEGVQVGPTE